MTCTLELPLNQRLKSPRSIGDGLNTSDFGRKENPRNKIDVNVSAANNSRQNSASGQCPCCGAELKSQQTRVDLDTNTFLFRGHSVSLTKKEAELIEILLRRSPGVVAHDTLISRLWGLDEPEFASKNIQVRVCRLRKLLRPLGVDIINVFDVGYRISLEGAK